MTDFDGGRPSENYDFTLTRRAVSRGVAAAS